MPAIITLAALTLIVVKNAPSWLDSLLGTLLDKGREAAADKGKDYALTRGKSLANSLFHLDEKEQVRHLQQALQNATERGLAAFDALEQRDQYKDILHTLSQPGHQGNRLRQEIMQLFTLSDTPDLSTLSELYNQRQRFYDAAHQDIDAAPYLISFFNALLAELYADPYFKQQLSNALQIRAFTSVQRSFLDIVSMLKDLNITLQDRYTAQNLARDIETYTAHIERTLHNLKIVGVVPKDQNSDPELNGIFVPLRIALKGQSLSYAAVDMVSVAIDSNLDGRLLPDPTLNSLTSHRTDLDDQALPDMTLNGLTPRHMVPIEQRSSRRLQPDTLITTLEAYPYLVLLGGPGSGKSTVTKYLAWSHAAANQSTLSLPPDSLLPGNPLPLRVELRRLSEERKRDNYDFLSFATQVLLKREGIEINPQMFKELLKRRGMLLLFDGLDEVATMEERRTMVEEIEHFALTYPGNRVLVTSRPVGYDLTRISHPLFSHAEVQGFDDTQIKQFLDNWYTAVLRLSPIPQREQEELDLLLTTVQENPRLHKLAENPLLLTVITVLHRYERLPDRRVLVYDRCADLLLETWARLRGTNVRWKDLRMGKEEQYACVASLGFVLHQRSQEEMTADHDDEAVEETVDVSSRFLRTNVENYLRKQKSITGGAELRAEAARFIALIQEEAGLIVERGTDENGEPLYSFVHRTFQEYFAAADIYERYLQKEDPKVISKFLVEHLHDPHWREVIFLLLGKLKSTPVTNQLRNILLYKTKSRRSNSTHILQQDLFFICDCLLEEIKIENTLAEMVKSRLGNVVKSSPFLEQQQEALEYLGKIAQTRQYAEYGRKELLALATNNSLDSLTRLKAAQNLHLYSSALSEEGLQANQLLTTLVQQLDLTVDQVIETMDFLNNYDLERSAAQELAIAMLSALVKRTDLSVEQTREVAEFLYRWSEEGSAAQELAIATLSALMKRTDLSVEQTRETAESLYRWSEEGLAVQELAMATLSALMKRTDLSVEQTREVAESLYRWSEEGSAEQELAMATLSALVERTDLSAEQVQEIAESLYESSEKGSVIEELAIATLSALMKRTDLSVEQVREVAESLYRWGEEGSAEQELVIATLSALMKRTDLSVEQTREVAEFLYSNSREGTVLEELAIAALGALVKRTDLSVEQVRETAEFLYLNSREGAVLEELAIATLSDLVKRMDLSVEQMRKTAKSLYENSEEGSTTRELSRATLGALVKRTDLSVEQTREAAESLYESSKEGSAEQELAIATLGALVKRTDLSVEQVRKGAEFLYLNSTEGSVLEEISIATLSDLVKRSDLSVEQLRETVKSLYDRSSERSVARELAIATLSALVKRADLSAKQMWEVAESLYESSEEGSTARELAIATLSDLVKRSALSVEQVWEAAESLSVRRVPRLRRAVRRRAPGLVDSEPVTSMMRVRRRFPRSLARELAISILSILVKQGDLSAEQMRETAKLLYEKSEEGSEARLLATSILLTLLPQVDKLENKTDIYGILREMVPQFHKLQQPS